MLPLPTDRHAAFALALSIGPYCSVKGNRVFRPKRPVACPTVTAIATVRILCETNPSLGTAIVNGVLACATVLGACTAFFAGLPAALLALDATPAHVRADLINRGLGIGFRVGMLFGPLMFFVFSARVVA